MMSMVHGTLCMAQGVWCMEYGVMIGMCLNGSVLGYHAILSLSFGHAHLDDEAYQERNRGTKYLEIFRT